MLVSRAKIKMSFIALKNQVMLSSECF